MSLHFRNQSQLPARPRQFVIIVRTSGRSSVWPQTLLIRTCPHGLCGQKRNYIFVAILRCSSDFAALHTPPLLIDVIQSSLIWIPQSDNFAQVLHRITFRSKSVLAGYSSPDSFSSHGFRCGRFPPYELRVRALP